MKYLQSGRRRKIKRLIIAAGIVFVSIFFVFLPVALVIFDNQQPLSIPGAWAKGSGSPRIKNRRHRIPERRWHPAAGMVEPRGRGEAPHHFCAWIESIATRTSRARGRIEQAGIRNFALRFAQPRREWKRVHDARNHERATTSVRPGPLQIAKLRGVRRCYGEFLSVLRRHSWRSADVPAPAQSFRTARFYRSRKRSSIISILSFTCLRSRLPT